MHGKLYIYINMFHMFREICLDTFFLSKFLLLPCLALHIFWVLVFMRCMVLNIFSQFSFYWLSQGHCLLSSLNASFDVQIFKSLVLLHFAFLIWILRILAERSSDQCPRFLYFPLAALQFWVICLSLLSTLFDFSVQCEISVQFHYFTSPYLLANIIY